MTLLLPRDWCRPPSTATPGTCALAAPWHASLSLVALLHAMQLSFSSAQHPSIVQSTDLWKHLYLPLAPYRHTSVLNERLPDDDPRSTTKKDMADKPSVLFVCVHNAGRSQMAAGFLSHLAGDAVEVRSAGSAPADSINSIVVEAMREEGIDLSDKKPKILTTDAVQASDVVITMGCGDVCPIFPGKRYLDWQLD